MHVVILTAVWCHSCLFMKKTFKAFAANHPEWTFEFLDIDLDENAKQYNLGKVLPIVLFHKEGQEVLRLTGEKSLEQLESETRHAH